VHACAQDYLHLHREHGNWVTQLDWVPEVGLVSSSLDASIKVFDIHRERVSHSCSHHAKGVHGFVWCAAYSCFASCGQERDVIVWHVSYRHSTQAPGMQRFGIWVLLGAASDRLVILLLAPRADGRLDCRAEPCSITALVTPAMSMTTATNPARPASAGQYRTQDWRIERPHQQRDPDCAGGAACSSAGVHTVS
jgi:WD40 repeat protein